MSLLLRRSPLVLALLALAALAPAAEDDEAARRRLDENLDPLLGWLMASYLPGGHAQADGVIFLPSDSDAESSGGEREIGQHEASFSAAQRIAINARAGVLIGASYGLLGFDDEAGILPDQLHRVGVDIGGWYSPTPRLLLWAQAQPSLRSDFDQVDGDAFRVPAAVIAAYTFNSRFTLVGGLISLGLREDNLVLPIVGAWWRPTFAWNVVLTPIFATVDYGRADSRWRFYATIQASGGEYQLADDDAGEDVSLRYRDGRVRIGTRCKLNHRWSLDAGVGAAFWRQVEYDLEDEDAEPEPIDIDPAPFAALGLTARW
ncbi:MAG: hypothetical protein H0X45_04920 [Planctomycetes bacterium]|nr:hypothetical protein [Planctomycetota bacterium]